MKKNQFFRHFSDKNMISIERGFIYTKDEKSEEV